MAYNEDTRIVLDEMMKRLREEKKVSEQLLTGLENLIEGEQFGDKLAVAALLDGLATAGEESQQGDAS